MELSKIITDKLNELAELAKLEGEPNTQIVILAIEGARLSGQSGELAAGVKVIMQEVLIPGLQKKREQDKANKN